MAALTDRASLLRAFFRLLNTDEDDDALTEHDDSTLEAAYQHLQHGAWEAQLWMLQLGHADRWVTTIDFPDDTDSSWQGTESSDGGRYASLPSDFLRLAGDEETSALRKPTGRRWGKLIPHEMRFRYRGNYYWLQNENLWIARGANSPPDLKMDYHPRLATLADGTTVDFPVEDRPLIPAFAAALALDDSWVALHPEEERKVLRNLERRKARARMRARRSREPRHIGSKEVRGTHWFV